MIVAVGDFNMGAMENKSLNIFNTKYVLVNPQHRHRYRLRQYRGGGRQVAVLGTGDRSGFAGGSHLAHLPGTRRLREPHQGTQVRFRGGQFQYAGLLGDRGGAQHGDAGL